MKKYLLLLMITVSATVFSQITITQNDFPDADDTVMVTVSNNSFVDLILTGADVTWDYSDLIIEAQRIDTFFDVSDAGFVYQLQFNNPFIYPGYASTYFYPLIGFNLGDGTGLGVTIEDPIGFVKISSSKVENVGIGIKLNGFDVPMTAEEKDMQYQLPMNYTDTWTSNSYFNVDLNPAMDAIFIRHQYRNSEVDGWGELITPFGTFEVLRVRSELSYDDSVYVDFGFGGTWFELPTPDQVEYTWWSTGNKIAVLKVVTQNILGNETITQVEFKDKDRNLLNIENPSAEFEGKLFPNPATNVVHLTCQPEVTGVAIFSITGQLIYQSTLTDAYIEIDVSAFASGVYTVQLISDKNVSVTKLVIE